MGGITLNVPAINASFKGLWAGKVIAGTFTQHGMSFPMTLPDNCDRKTPVLIMETGSGLQNRDEEMFSHKPFAVIADAFARAGIATLRYDDRGFGEEGCLNFSPE